MLHWIPLSWPSKIALHTSIAMEKTPSETAAPSPPTLTIEPKSVPLMMRVCLRNSDSVQTEEQPDKQTTGEEQSGIEETTPVPTPPSDYASTGSADSSTFQADSTTTPTESIPSVTEPPTTSATPSSPSAKPSSPAQERPHCDISGDGDHPHPQRCEYYYRCLSGYLTIVRCPYKYGWDFPTKQCKPSSEAQCFSYSY